MNRNYHVSANGLVRQSRTAWLTRAVLLAAVVLAVAGIAYRGAATKNLKQAGAQAPAARSIAAFTPSVPLYFEPNQGQTDPQVKFLARGAGYGLFLTADEAVLVLQHSAPVETRGASASANSSRSAVETRLAAPRQSSVIRMHLEGASPIANIQAAQPLPGKSNYFIGNDPTKWRRNIPQFGRVEYQSVYPGIDLVYYGNDRQLEYDFRVAPGSDPSQIAISFQGASAHLDSGDLVLSTASGDVHFRAPHIYQPSANRPSEDRRSEDHQSAASRQTDIPGSFRLLAGNKIGFAVSPYDHSRELVIDPTLNYSTYLGGTGTQSLVKVAVDTANNIYLAGSTTSADFPVVNPISCCSTLSGAQNIFISVLNTSLTGTSQLIFSTYLGGNGTDSLAGLAVDGGFNIYVGGSTTSTNFPTSSNAFQQAGAVTFNGNQHGFVSQLAFASGAYSLGYSTYLAGTNLAGNSTDIVTGLAADNNGNAYVTGTTTSTDGPGTTNPSPGFPSNSAGYQVCPFAPPQTGIGCVVTSGPPQFFASKLSTSPTLSGPATMIYSTYFGGSSPTSGAIVVGGGAAVDSSGYVYFTGATNMPNLVGNSGGTVVSGPPNFPIYNAIQPCLNQPGGTTCNNPPTNPGDTDAILVKLNPSLSEPGLPPFFSTYLGGSLNDVGTAVAVDSVANSYVTGSTNSPDWSCVAPCNFGPNPPFGFNDTNATNAFIAQVTNQTSANTIYPLTYFAWLGGSVADGNSTIGQAIAVDSVTGVHVAGSTSSPNLPINFNSLTDYLQTYQGNGDAFVVLDALNTPTVTTGDYITYLGGAQLDQGTGIALNAGNNTYVAGTTLSPPCSSPCTPPNIVGFPITTNAYQPVLNGSAPNAFVTVLGSNSNIVVSAASGSPNPSPVNAGQGATFSFNITNNGPDPAANINFYATVPSNFLINPTASLIQGIGVCYPFQPGQTVISCTINNLADGASATVEVVVTPPSPPPSSPVAVTCSFTVNGGALQSCPNTADQQDKVVDFTITGSPSTLTVQNGNLASFVITVAPLPGESYDGTISLSQSSSKAIVTSSTPTFTPSATVTLDGTGSQTATLNIQTVARPINTGSLFRRTSLYATWLPIGGLSLAGLGIGAARKRRRWIAGALFGLLAALLLLQPACSSSSNNVSVNQGTQAGTYFITVTGSSSTNASHQTILTLNVT